MSFAPYIPILVALLSVLGGAILYHVQKSVDRQTELKRERRELYRRYIFLFQELKHQISIHAFGGNVAEDLMPLFNDLAKADNEILITAPDQVVEACWETRFLFLKLSALYSGQSLDVDKAKESEAQDRLSVKRAEIIFAMRHDTFESTNISRSIIKSSVDGLLISVGSRQP